MNTQQAYEKMRAWLTRPGATRSYEGQFCQYETSDGNRCVVGALLSPAAIQELRVSNGGSIADLHERQRLFSLAWAELDGVDRAFLESAQIVHDRVENWTDEGINIDLLDQLAAASGLRVVADEQVTVVG